MSSNAFSNLDQAELLQLALNASRGNDSATAISYLKEAVSRADCSAIAHYILGAEYAQIKMIDRAVGEMEAAIALDPALSIARFQLGLLCLSSGNAERAASIFAPLSELPVQDPLNRFGAGLQHLIRDEFADALRCLNDGIALNASNAPLNADMQKIIHEIEALPAPEPSPAKSEDAIANEIDSALRHIMISAYTGNGNN
jgi:tetratricopeptide (TPR) repeat protein